MEVYNLSQYKLSRMKQKINEGKKNLYPFAAEEIAWKRKKRSC